MSIRREALGGSLDADQTRDLLDRGGGVAAPQEN
jgi:hypothetical protein